MSEDKRAPDSFAKAQSTISECRKKASVYSLQTAVDILRKALGEHPLRLDILRQLIITLFAAYSMDGWVEHCIAIMNTAMNITPEMINASPSYDNVLADENIQKAHDILSDFRKSLDGSAIETAIGLYREALAIYGASASIRVSSLAGLAEALVLLSNIRHDENDVISFLQESCHLFPTSDPNRFKCLLTLSVSFAVKYTRTLNNDDWEAALATRDEAREEDREGMEASEEGSIFADSRDTSRLNKGVALLETSLAARPFPHPLRYFSLTYLGEALFKRYNYQLAGSSYLDDLDRCIACQREAAEIRPPPQSSAASELGELLIERYYQSRQVTDLDEAATCYRQILEVQPASAGQSETLSNLGYALALKSKSENRLGDLLDAIKLQRGASESPLLSPTKKALVLTSLSSSLFQLYEKMPKSAESGETLNEAVMHQQAALEIIPVKDPHRHDIILNLGQLFSERYDLNDDVADLDQAVVLLKEASSFKGPQSPLARVTSCDRLANALSKRFVLDSNSEDLEASISFQRKALDCLPVSHPNRAYRAGIIASLAQSLTLRYIQTILPSDIDESITLYEEAITSWPAFEVSWCPNYIDALHRKFVQSNDVTHLEKAIRLGRKVLESQSEEDASYGDTLSLLAFVLNARYSWAGQISDSEEAIRLYRQTLDLQPIPHPRRHLSLRRLGGTFWDRYERTADVSDLDESIAALKEASDLKMSQPHRDRLLHRLAFVLGGKYELTENDTDLADAVHYHIADLELRPSPRPDRALSLNNYAKTILTRLRIKGELQDLDQAIGLLEEALHLIQAWHPERHHILYTLAGAYKIRYDQQGHLSDLQRGISLHRNALELRAAPHPKRAMSLNDLASALAALHEHTDHLSDLDEAISLHREAAQFLPAPQVDLPMVSSDLAGDLLTRYDRTNHFPNLEEAITLYQTILNLPESPRVQRAMILSRLGGALFRQYERHGDAADLSEAIALGRQAVELSTTQQDRAVIVNNLVVLLLTGFDRTGNLSDLEESIRFYRETLQVVSPSNLIDRASVLSNLASVVLMQYEWNGNLLDLEESIGLLREVVTLLPNLHPDLPQSLTNLAAALHRRYERNSNLPDLEETIALERQALNLLPSDHPRRVGPITNLAASLSLTGEWKDLEESISLFREALGLIPAPHPEHGQILYKLGMVYSQVEERTGQRKDLDESISWFQQALNFLPSLSPLYIWCSTRLSNMIGLRFERSDRLDDLEESILLGRVALDRIPDGHPYRIFGLELAVKLEVRFSRLHVAQDLEDAVVLFRSTAACQSLSVHERLLCMHTWGKRAAKNHHMSAQEAYELAIELLPRLISLDMDLNNRQAMLPKVEGLASDACAYAITASNLEKAVEYLSAGRLLFWSQVLHIRTPLTKLQSVSPDLAAQLRDLSVALETASFRDPSRSIQNTPQKLREMEQEARRYRMLNEKWNETLEEVRKVEGFRGFLQNKPFSQLQQAAMKGPVVLLNAAEERCDGLVITQDGIVLVPFPNVTLGLLNALHIMLSMALSPEDIHSNDILGQSISIATRGIDDRYLRLEAKRVADFHNLNSDDLFRCVLGVLWLHIVLPVIENLGIASHDRDKYWHKVSDYVVSSYTPSLDTLLVPSPSSDSTLSVLAVIQSKVPGRPGLDLPFTIDELNTIKKHVPEQQLVTLGGDSTQSALVKHTLSHLSNASIAHFACHGFQDVSDPLASHLVLHDGNLKISQIMKQSMPNASLAFLSACETAKGSENIPDEAMHMSASMLFAGFRGVVGTMWTINDEDAPYVANLFYGHLFRQTPPDTTEAAFALHLAVSMLRDKKGVNFKRWIPFIHMGL